MCIFIMGRIELQGTGDRACVDIEKPCVDIEKLLAEGKTLQLHPRGYSMYPLFVPGRDEAVIAPADVSCLGRGDVALYRRKGGILVLHRVWKRKGGAFYMVGDNQCEIEGPLGEEQVRGVLTGVVRKGRRFSVKHPLYRVLSHIWLLLRPLRPVLSKTAAGIKKIFR